MPVWVDYGWVGFRLLILHGEREIKHFIFVY